MEPHFLDLLARDGVWVVFIAQTLGIFGLPIPDELLLILAGGLVRRGDLRGSTAVAAAIAGSALGLTLSYTLGRVGIRVVQHLPIESDALARAQSWFKRDGKWLLVFGCFVPGVRHVTALAAGSASLDFRTFCAYAYPGATLWSTTFVGIGYYAGSEQRWEQAALLLRAHLVLVAILLAALAVMYAFAGRHSSVQRRARARNTREF
jgi:membrane protein DedA with SNARE-associated domain